MLLLKEFAPIEIYKRRFARASYQQYTRTWSTPSDVEFKPEYASVYSWHIPNNGEDPNFAMPVIHEIIFDFDSFDLEQAQRDTLNFLRYLSEIHDVDPATLGIWFSGMKGFHITMPIMTAINIDDPEAGLWGIKPQVIRDFALQLGTGFKTLDHSVYDGRRLFRVPYGIHAESGLHKMPLSFVDLHRWSSDEIRKRAAEPKAEFMWTFDDPETSSSLFEMLLQISETSEKTEEHRDPLRMPLSAIFDVAAPGERNVRATQLAGVLVKTMDDLPMIREIVKLWNRQLQYPLSQHELDVITTGVYQRYHERSTNNRRKKTNEHVAGF